MTAVFILIERLNKFYEQYYGLEYYEEMETELEAECKPDYFIEYDHNGYVITNEVIGYDNEGEPIWKM
jgi:hypothetical protein